MPVAVLNKKLQSNIAGGESILPLTIQTPSGLALLDIQGTIRIGNKALTGKGGLGLESQSGDQEDDTGALEHVGEFDFSGVMAGGSEVLLRVGKSQLMRGKLEKLKKPVAVLRIESDEQITTEDEVKQIDVIEIVYYKLAFATMPEHVMSTPAR
jgi:chromosome transmission fidelity protein 8